MKARTERKCSDQRKLWCFLNGERQGWFVCLCICWVSLFLVVHGPPGYKEKGSRGSMQVYVRPMSTMEIACRESALVLFQGEGRCSGWEQQLGHHLICIWQHSLIVQLGTQNLTTSWVPGGEHLPGSASKVRLEMG